MAEERKRRQRRSFTDEFKAEVVKKVLSSGKTAGQVARELDLTETAVRHWVKQAQVDRGKGHRRARSPGREGGAGPAPQREPGAPRGPEILK
jgi:transposase-like protein